MDTTIQRSSIDLMRRQAGEGEIDLGHVANLRELRPLLPGIVDVSIRTLNNIPKQVRDEVDNRVVAYISARKGLNSVLDAQKTGANLGGKAKRGANTEVNRVLPLLKNLKYQAQRGDDVALRSALQSLDNERVFSKTFSFNINARGRRYAVYSKTFKREVFPALVIGAETASELQRSPAASISSCQRFISRASHALANFRSSYTVVFDTPRTSAVSSYDNPPKNICSTARAQRSSN